MYDGENVWDYRRLTTVSIEGDITGFSPEEDESNSESEKQVTQTALPDTEFPPKKTSKVTRQRDSKKLPTDLNWITEQFVNLCSSLGGKDTTAQVHPYRFTNFILKKAVEDSNGALELILGKVNKILYLMDTGVATGITYEPTSAKRTSTSQ